jgi:RimJ/RimL family protein N-acetyltransferase
MYKHKNGLILRLLEKDDLLLMKNLKDESWFGTHRITLNNMEQQRLWFSSLNNKDCMFFIVEDGNNKKIGTYKITSIDWVSRTYHSAHDVFKEHRGKGWSKPVLECGVDFGFEVLNMHRIDTEVLENNIASLKTALWVGFQKEGLKRESVFKCNHYLDSICLGIIRKDWVQLQRIKNMGGLCNVSYTPKDKKED